MTINQTATYKVVNNCLHSLSMNLKAGKSLLLPPFNVGAAWPEIKGSDVNDELSFYIKKGQVMLKDVPQAPVEEAPVVPEAPTPDPSIKPEVAPPLSKNEVQ
jgi:hypothetical protein